MNVSRMNLNLLKALDALLECRHVTRAGEKIHITQSAMSTSLAQLREIFEDELLIREGKAMQLTPKALELAPKVKRILEEIEQVIAPIQFTPSTCTDTFRIGMSDYVEFALLPKLLPLFEAQAPQAQLKVIHLNALDRKEHFDNLQLDVGIGTYFGKKTGNLNSETIFTDGSACVARRDHPFMQKQITLKQYLAAKHLVIIFPDEPYLSRIDDTLEKLGHKRQVTVAVQHMLPALFALSNTSAIATTTSIIANTLAEALNLSVQPPPFTTKPVIVEQAWPKRLENDSKNMWLRELIREAAGDIVV